MAEMAEGLGSLIPSAVVLGAVGIIALFLTLTRKWAGDRRKHLPRVARITAAVVLLQAVHFIEEFATELHERLPALFGRSAIPIREFVLFNVAWLVIWSLSAWGLAAGRRAALFPLWFLALGCVVNGIAHPLLSLWAGSYFPGLLTSPILGVMGVVLIRHLALITDGGPGWSEAA